MSQIERLLAEHCPEGVEYRPLRDLIDYQQPGPYLVNSKTYDDTFPTPVLTAGKSFILGYSDETDGLYPASAEHPVVIFDDFTTAFRWVDFPFKAKSSAMKMLRPKDGSGVEFRYAFYAMQTLGYAPQDHARQWIGTYSRFRIPVPPIEVQREIVAILDRMERLEAELEAELEARRRQYAYYRDALLTFDEAGGVRWVPMGEVGTFIRGRRFTRNDLVDDGLPAIHYGDIYTRLGVAADAACSNVRPDLASRLRFAQPGDVVLAAVGETVEDVAKAVAWIGDDPVAIHDDTFLFRSDVDAKFTSYFMQSRRFHEQKNRHVARAKVKRVSSEGLSMIEMPMPSMSEQQRIVAILDSFDALVNDLSSGLPAEIAARRKQYEYYRDRLLSFEELAA